MSTGSRDVSPAVLNVIYGPADVFDLLNSEVSDLIGIRQPAGHRALPCEILTRGPTLIDTGVVDDYD